MRKIIWKRLWARKFSPFIASCFIKVFHKNSSFPYCANKLFVPEGNLYAIYFKESEFHKVVKNFTKYLLKQNINKYAVKYEKSFKKFFLWVKRKSRFNYQKLTNKKLIGELLELEIKMVPFSELQFFAFVVLEGPTHEVEKRLVNQRNGVKFIEAIATPHQETIITKARLELLRIIAQGRLTKKNLARYAKEYAWLSVYEFIDNPLTIADIKNSLPDKYTAEEEFRIYLKHRKLALQDYNNYLINIKNRRLKKLIAITHIFSYLKEMRDDYRRNAYYLLRPLWQEVAARTKLSFIDTNYLLINELTEIIKTGKNRFGNEIAKRKKCYALTYANGKEKIFTGQEAMKIAELVKIKSRTKSQIRGTPANQGRVSGKVAIISHQGEFHKFKTNNILVATMTHPEYLPIIRKAKAIVTDEGGITCHAAIISRELDIPCIVGTKIATKVLKDGDLVEVDADQGIVKKLI